MLYLLFDKIERKCRVTCINLCRRINKNNNNGHIGHELGRSGLLLQRGFLLITYVETYNIISTFFMFLLLLISTHEMRRLMLMVNDANLFADIHNQHQPIVLKRENQ